MGPIVLCILDGWGISADQRIPDDCIRTAPADCFTSLWERWPHSLLEASGVQVGLPEGQMGNSEVGHMTIGAGRRILQDLPRIDESIKTGEFKERLAPLMQNSSPLHMMGIMSEGGVHGQLSHLIAFAEFLAPYRPIHLHLFLDGRDTPPKSAISFMEQLVKAISSFQNISIATLSGRYYGMDRDQRWDRIEKACEVIMGRGNTFTDPLESLKKSYQNNITDEFFIPLRSVHYKGPQAGDEMLMMNFRADRARQILSALLDPHFNHFGNHFPWGYAYGLTDYSEAHKAWMRCLYPHESIEQTLGQTLSEAGLKQLRVAETEKYAHVTFFLNGGKESPFPQEERILVPSPAVATYDLKPEMSAFEICAVVEDAVLKQSHPFIVVNFANADMVGHTGNQDATRQAIRTLDQCLERLSQKILQKHGILLITADHGNAEQMIDPATGEPHTAHTSNLVPFIAVGYEGRLKKTGTLANIAPTVLRLLDVKIPPAMTAESLIESAP